MCPIVFFWVLPNGCRSITLVSFVKRFLAHADIHVLKKQTNRVSLWCTGLNPLRQILKFVHNRRAVVRFKEHCISLQFFSHLLHFTPWSPAYSFSCCLVFHIPVLSLSYNQSASSWNSVGFLLLFFENRWMGHLKNVFFGEWRMSDGKQKLFLKVVLGLCCKHDGSSPGCRLLQYLL